ncbi:hypothetical protein, partial [Pseudomonas kitaguniensis]|uniref:hypothetical protein n=1 Tax=Pseudomonas kitaguniensis TaxID=2607908 RepID=UPI003D01C9DC
GAGLLAIALCQLKNTYQTHRHREQARSHKSAVDPAIQPAPREYRAGDTLNFIQKGNEQR